MIATIDVQPRNVWKLFMENKAALRTKLKQIASNEEYGVEIYLTNTDEQAEIVVCMDGSECCSQTASTEAECEEVVSEIYDDYLTNNVLNMLCGDEYGDADAEEWQLSDIEDREAELDDMVYTFISGILNDDFMSYPEFDKICEDCKEHFLEYMARKWKIPICRPMILEDDNGDTFFEEFPYECMEFDDPDNPLYK